MEQNLDKLKGAFYIVGIVSIATYAYFHYFWQPNVEVLSVNYELGTAQIKIDGVEQTLYSSSTLNVGHGWGIKFSPHHNIKTPNNPYRVELVKDHLVMKYLDIQKRG